MTSASLKSSVISMGRRWRAAGAGVTVAWAADRGRWRHHHGSRLDARSALEASALAARPGPRPDHGCGARPWWAGLGVSARATSFLVGSAIGAGLGRLGTGGSFSAGSPWVRRWGDILARVRLRSLSLGLSGLAASDSEVSPWDPRLGAASAGFRGGLGRVAWRRRRGLDDHRQTLRSCFDTVARLASQLEDERAVPAFHWLPRISRSGRPRPVQRGTCPRRRPCPLRSITSRVGESISEARITSPWSRVSTVTGVVLLFDLYVLSCGEGRSSVRLAGPRRLPTEHQNGERANASL